MELQLVTRVLNAFEDERVPFLLEGGWGVDALIGRPTRPHRDLDLVVDFEDLSKATECLASLDFRPNHGATPGLPARWVMNTPAGDEADVHPIFRDTAGNGWQALSDDGAWGLYSADGLRGVGIIGGKRVRCTTPELQVRHRLGYRLRSEDLHDLQLLREHFGVSIPPSRSELDLENVLPDRSRK